MLYEVITPVDSLEIERPVADISDADIDAMLESMRRQRVTYTPVERAGLVLRAEAAGGECEEPVDLV